MNQENIFFRPKKNDKWISFHLNHNIKSIRFKRLLQEPNSFFRRNPLNVIVIIATYSKIACNLQQDPKQILVYKKALRSLTLETK